VTLSVGILAGDVLRLGEQIDQLGDAGIEMLHVDVMDGVFCPQVTVGPQFVAALPAGFVVDVHLMVADPLEKLDDYVDAGAGILTFHLEATPHPHRALQSLAGTGIKRGVALNPGTPIGAVEPLLDELELVLVLAVNPGWSGQSFIPATAGRLAAARELIEGRDILLAVDGGVTRENIGHVASLGPDVVVAGSAVFAGADLTDSARSLLAATTGADRAETAGENAADARFL
jgi:ribulose-phosphate 3-epimerase